MISGFSYDSSSFQTLQNWKSHCFQQTNNLSESKISFMDLEMHKQTINH